jgi:hypothetical protein
MSSLWALTGVTLVISYATSDWQACAGVLMISQAFVGGLVWKRFSALRAAVLPDFLSLVLFNQFITKTLSLLGVFARSLGDSASTTLIDELSRYETVPLEYQFQAELVFLLATITFTILWIWQEGKRPLALWDEPPSRMLWMTYAVCLFVFLGLSASGFGVALGLVPDLFRLASIGALAILLGGRSAYALGASKSWLAILALSPFFYGALQTGMKSEVGFVSLPILLPIFRRITVPRLAVLCSFLAFVVLFVFPFSQSWREANWYARGNSQQVGIREVAANVLGLWEEDGLFATAQSSTGKWLVRGSSSESGGLVMQLADRDGLIGPVLIEGLATIFVPRFLWPDKPTYAPGAWFTWYLGQAESPETATTSTAMMLATELYWMFGVAGVLFGMAVLSVLYFTVWRVLLKASVKGLLPKLAMFALVARAGGMEEVHTVYAVSSPIILLIYVLVLNTLLEIVVPKVGHFFGSNGRS